MAILKMFTADMQAPFSRMTRSSASIVRSTTQKRTGASSMKFAGGNYHANMGIGGTATALYVGFWLYFEAGITNPFQVTISEGATGHVGLVFQNGVITIRRGNNPTDTNNPAGTTLATLSKTLGVGQSAFFEMYVSINDSTGAVTVKVDGVQDTALTNQDTKNGGSGYATNLYFTSGSVTAYVDDVTMANDWPGTGGIYTRWPTGAGANAEWTASTGNAYECVDADTDGLGDMTDYIGDDTTADQHDFAMGDLGFTAVSIGAVEAVAFGTVPTGSASARVYVDSGGTVTNGSDTALDSAGVLMTSGLMTVDPATSSAWDTAGVDALVVGVESRA